MTTHERFELQFESCFRKQPVKPMSGLEKEAKEVADTKQFWTELKKFKN